LQVPIYPLNAQGQWLQNPGIQQNQTQFRNQQEFINALSFRPRTQGVSSALNTNSPRQSLPNNNSGPWAGIKTFGPTNQNVNYNNGQQVSNQINGRNFANTNTRNYNNNQVNGRNFVRDQEQPPQQQISFIDSNNFNNNFPYQNFGWGWNGFNPSSPVWVDPSNGFDGNAPGQTYPTNNPPGSGNFDGGNNNLPPLDGDDDIFIMTRQRSSNSTRSRSASTTSTTTEEPTTTTTTEPTTRVPELSDSAKALLLSNESVDRFRRIVTQIREITRRELKSQ
jgi:hypothetical protein